MDLSDFAWRDGVLLVAVAVGIYLAVTLLRLVQIGQRRSRALRFHGAEAAAANEAGGNAADILAFNLTPAGAVEAEPGTGRPEADELPVDFPFTPRTIRPAVAAAPTAGVAPAPTFEERLNATRLEQEVRELRTELAALREELAELQAARRVSPQYADAMALAQRGFDVQGIAEHCAISRGEAELVLALSRGRAGGDGSTPSEDHDDGTQYRGFAVGR